MSKRSGSGRVRNGARALALCCVLSLAAVSGGCGGRLLTVSDYDEPGRAGAASRAGAAGSGGYSAGAPGAGGANTAGANTAGANTAGAPAGGALGCAFNVACNDGNACTIDGCDNGLCRHQLIAVDDGNACTTDSCDPVSGISHSPVPLDDHDACTKDVCDFFQGVWHFGYDIDDHDACTADSCDPKTGAIAHAFASIDDKNPCTDDTCDAFTGVITHTPLFFDDGNACTADQCDPLSGLLITTPIDCNDDNPCTTDSCNPSSGCQHTGGAYFSEDFSGIAPGWDFGPGWQLGPAQHSVGESVGGGDPGEDHSPGFDNRLAGVVIGGNVSIGIQPPSYLTSPVIDLSKVPGPVTLEFWRWLNADYPPYMASTVEVFDGMSWFTVYDVPNNSGIVSDSSWTLYQLDVSQYANPQFRVRWSWSIGSAGVYTMSGWNIDDVRVTGGSLSSCP